REEPFAVRPRPTSAPAPALRVTPFPTVTSATNRYRIGADVAPENSVCLCVGGSLGRSGRPGGTVRRMSVGAVLDEGSDLLVVTEIDVDSPGPREVALRTLATGLCHSDLHYLDGVLTRPRPVLLGHEAVGVVESVGPGVESVAVSDRGVTCLVGGCGTCARCGEGGAFVCSNPNATRRPRGERAR